MIENTYRNIMRKNGPSPQLLENTVRRIREETAPEPAARRPVRRVLVTALACVLVLSLSVTALAAGVPGFRTWLFGPHSGVADVLTPVTAAGASDGLEMQVLGAAGDAENVYVYFTVQDVDGRSRLSENTQIYAAAKLNGEYPEREDEVYGGMEWETEVVSFDPETQTVLCCFHMKTGREWADNPTKENPYADHTYDATGASIRLRVTQFWDTATTLEPQKLSLEGLAAAETVDVSAVRDTFFTSHTQFSFQLEKDDLITVEEYEDKYREMYAENPYLPAAPFENFRDETGRAVFLKPGSGFTAKFDDRTEITAAGFIDGKLHIQTRSYDYLDRNFNFHVKGVVSEFTGVSVICANAGAQPALSGEERNYRILQTRSFYLDESGKAVSGMVNTREEAENGFCYDETVFDVSPDDLADYDIYITAGTGSHQWVNFTADTFVLEGVTPEELLAKLSEK